MLSQWAASTSWIYASGSQQYLSPDDFKKFIGNARDQFLMVRARDGRAIGAVSWRTAKYPASFEIGAMIGDATRWQSGFGIESLMALIGKLFDTQHAHRVEFICGAFNKAAIQACCSGLIQIEGVLRDYYFVDGTYQDAVIGSILRDEYYSMTPAGESVPNAEKEEARNILREHLTKNPIELRKQ